MAGTRLCHAHRLPDLVGHATGERVQAMGNVCTTPIDLRIRSERVTGIEPALPAWKAGTLPLSYTRED